MKDLSNPKTCTNAELAEFCRTEHKTVSVDLIYAEIAHRLERLDKLEKALKKISNVNNTCVSTGSDFCTFECKDCGMFYRNYAKDILVDSVSTID